MLGKQHRHTHQHPGWLAVVPLLLIATSASAAREPIAPNVTLYVAADGNDAWSGTLPGPSADAKDGPLATLSGARDRIRRLRADGKVKLPVDVLLRAGRHFLDKTVEFELADSADAQTPVTFAPYCDEKVELCGGRAITGWTVKDGVWTVELPETKSGEWYFRSLFVDGKRAQRARTPDDPDHFLYVGRLLAEPPGEKPRARFERRAHQGFVYRKGDLKAWPRLDEAVFFTYESWARGIRKVEALDESTRTVLFRRCSMWPAIHHGENRYWVENLPELLNAPGEWYLDRRSGVLSYIPRPGETPENTEVIAPRVSTFIRLRGDAANDRHVEYLHFRDLTFRYGDWCMEQDGYVAWQADVVVRGAIDLTAARHCSISRCEISRVGLYAINLAQGSRHVRIHHNHLYDLGGGGVKIGHNESYHYKYAFEKWPGGLDQGLRENRPLARGKRCGHCSAENNFIHHGGIIYSSGIGVCIARSSWNRVAHNEVSDFPYSGMSIGMNWDAGPTNAHDNLIEFNHIHRIGRRLMSDLGGIYLLGNSPGTVVRGNHVHDIHHRLYGSTGLYCDQGSSRILVEDNVFHHAAGTLFNGGSGQITVRNNIFAFARGATFWGLRGVRALRGNVILGSGEPLCARWDEPGGTGDDYNRNLYWQTTGEKPTWNKQEFDAWRAETGRDPDSRFADPRFADPDNGDFSLPTDSPALTLGFRPLDLSRVGLYGEREWVDLPNTVTPLPMADLMPGGGAKVVYDFEDFAPGDLPDGFVSHHRRDQGGDIVVTAETALAGKHSLMFKDSPEIDEDYNPHAYHQLGFEKGTVELSYGIRVEGNVTPTVELRDYASAATFSSGPSIRLDGKRRILANDRATGVTVTPGVWYRIRMQCRLGQGRNGVYDIQITLPDGTVKKLTELPYGNANFNSATWLGLVSSGKQAGRFFVDEVECKGISAQ